MRVARNVVIYSLSSFLAGAVPLLLLPVLTRVLTEDDFGAFATVTTLTALFTPAVMWGGTALLSVEYFARPRNHLPRLVSSLVLLATAVFVAALVIALMAGSIFHEQLKIPRGWLLIAPILAALALLPQLLLTLFRVRDEANKYGYVEVLTATITVLLTLLFVVVFGFDWTGRVYATVVCSTVVSIYAFVWLRRQGLLVPVLDKREIEEAFRFGAGVVPHDTCWQVIRLIDRLFLVSLLGLASAGQYAVASSVAGITLVVVGAFGHAWTPYVFSKLHSGGEQAKRSIVRLSYIAILGFLTFFALFNVATPAFYAVFVDDKFDASRQFVVWLTLGYFFWAVSHTYVDYILLMKRTRVLSMVTLFNMLCNLALNYVLIRRFGAIGAAYAFAATMFVAMTLAFIVSNHLYPMPWLFWLRAER
jgi:O-antigen/teichoic acid export membrane protein